MALNENAKKWVAALRSERYEQGRGALRTGNSFCCLGVACELAAQEKVIGPAVQGNSFFEYDGNKNYLPISVRDWLGLQDSAGAISDHKVLSYMNDSGISFAEIADVIESEPEGLFA